MENNSWVKIFRSLLNWEWYHDVVTRDLFIHCLLKANYKSTTWKGISIGEGEFITSLENLAQKLNFSVRNIRTAIKHLKSTNEITTKPTNKYTLIKIVNWGLFQMVDIPNDTLDNTLDDNQSTCNRHASDKQVTTVKELKKEKKERSKELKHKYGEYNHVLLTDKQHDKLKIDFPRVYEKMIKNLDEYLEITPKKKYDNHNLVLRKWQRDRPIKVTYEKEKILDPFGNEYGSEEFDEDAYNNAPTTITY